MNKIKKIVMIGPESTGKTSLSEKLSEVYNDPWVPEYAREYLMRTDGTYQKGDLLQIAKGQIQNEESKIKNANRFLFCDTDLLVIKVWSEHIYQSCDEWILDQIEKRTYDYYFLCKNDFPWKADPLRESPNDGDYFYEKFRSILRSTNKPFCELSGSVEERINKAKNILDDLN